MELDTQDRKILSILKEDSRTPYADIGKKVHLSAPAVHARVRKLENIGVIKKHSIEIAPDKLGANVCAFVRVTRQKISCDSIADALAKFPEVEECHSVAGEDCILIKVRTSTPLALTHLLDRIRATAGVERTVTIVVLQSHFERGTAP